MKKILTLAMMLASVTFVTQSAEAKTTESPKNVTVNNAVDPQVRIQIGPRRGNRRVRTTTQVRTVRRGRALFRETYRTTYLPNGRVQTRLISRIRIR